MVMANRRTRVRHRAQLYGKALCPVDVYLRKGLCYRPCAMAAPAWASQLARKCSWLRSANSQTSLA